MTIEKLYLQELFTKLGNYCQYQQQIQAVCLAERGSYYCVFKSQIILSVFSTARLAQSVEHETLNLRVVGSSPTLGDHFFRLLFHTQLRILVDIPVT